MSAKSKKSVGPQRAATPSKPVSERRVLTSQFKREAVELVKREGASVAEAARRLGIDLTLLRSWKLGPVHEPGVHGSADRRVDPDQHGWQWARDRQRDGRAVVVIGEARGDLPQELLQRSRLL
jgi:transposase